MKTISSASLCAYPKNIAPIARIVRIPATWALSVVLMATAITNAEESWPRFRGPNGDGRLADFQVSLPWEPTQIVAKVPLPGNGNGSPVIWGDSAYVLCADPDTADRSLVAIDIQRGKIRWTKTYPSEQHPLHKMSSYASSTPCVDESGVYVAWGAPAHSMLKSFTHDGQERWSVDWGRLVTQHGFGTSPVVVGDRVLLFASQDAEELPAGVEPGEDRMIAYDKETGRQVWERPLKTTRVCYGVPCIASDDSKSILFCASTGEGFFAIDVADGKQLWSVPMFQKRVCSSPILAGSRLIATEGSGGGGNILSAVGWKSADFNLVAAETPTLQYQIQRAASYVPTPIVDGDFLYTWADNGVVSCFDLATGKNQWSQRVGGNFSGSPVILGGKLINVSADGVLSIVKASPTYALVGTVDLGQSVRSTIAAISDRMVIRTDESLWIIAK